MANDIRMHVDAHAGELDALVGDNAGGTDLTLSSPQFAALPVVDANHHLPVTTATVDATTGEVTAYEVHWVTAHTAAATTVTVARGQEGSTAQAWPVGTRWWHAPTASDFTQRLAQKGTWVSTAHYAPNDVVQRSGASYIALVETTNEDPSTVPASWTPVGGSGGGGGSTGHVLYTGSAAPPNLTPVLNASSIAGTSQASPIPVTIPSTVKVDDIIVIAFSYNYWQAPSAPAGWTQILAAQMATTVGSTFNSAAGVWWKKAVLADIGSTVNITTSTNTIGVKAVVSYTDTDGTGPQQVTAFNQSTTFAFAQLTSLPANSRVVYVAAGNGTGYTAATPSVSGAVTDAAAAQGPSPSTELVIASEVMAAAGTNPARTATLPNFTGSWKDAVTLTFALYPNPAATAANGDTFLDKLNRRFYGQMASGAWGPATPLRHNDPVAKTAAYTAADGDIVLADATTAAFTVTLPAAAAGAKVTVKKTDASANAVTVSRAGAATIDGATTQALATQWSKLTVVSNGTNWYTL